MNHRSTNRESPGDMERAAATVWFGWLTRRAAAAAIFAFFCAWCIPGQAAPLAPKSLVGVDAPWDGGHAIRVLVDASNLSPGEWSAITIQTSPEKDGIYTDAGAVTAPVASPDAAATKLEATISGMTSNTPTWLRAFAVNSAGEKSPYLYAEAPAVAIEQVFDGNRFWFFVVLSFVCGSVIAMILIARTGAPMWIRKISALDAIDEAVGRATEMGKSCLFVTGVQDLNEIETIAGITVLSRVAEKAAEYDATVVVPTSRSLVMTAARETSQAAYLAAGRPDAYQEDRIYYVTDDQFGFVAHLSGYMMREKPAACFYMGQFYAESLLLGETGTPLERFRLPAPPSRHSSRSLSPPATTR